MTTTLTEKEQAKITEVSQKFIQLNEDAQNQVQGFMAALAMLAAREGLRKEATA